MSAVIKTTTPFVLQEVLFNALLALGCEPVLLTQENYIQYKHSGALEAGDIITNRVDYYGSQHFRYIKNQWVLRHDSSEMHGQVINSSKTSRYYQKVGLFLTQLETEYAIQYKSRLEQLAEQERQRIEEARKARVEETRKKAIEQAKAQGYLVKEKYINGKIQLVCSRSA